MTNLSHLFNPGQKVRVNFDGTFFKGTVAKTDVDYIDVGKHRGGRPGDSGQQMDLYNRKRSIHSR